MSKLNVTPRTSQNCETFGNSNKNSSGKGSQKNVKNLVFYNINIDSCSPGPLTVQSVTFTKCEGDLLTAQDTWCLWEVFICMSSKSESIISRLGLSD